MPINNQRIVILNNQGIQESGGGVTIARSLIAHLREHNRITYVSEGTEDGSVTDGTVTYMTIKLEDYTKQAFIWRFTPLLRSFFLRKRLSATVANNDIVIALDCKYAAAVWRYCQKKLKVYLSLGVVPMTEWKDRPNLQQGVLSFCQYLFMQRQAFVQADISFVSSKKHLAEIKRYEYIGKQKPYLVYPFLPKYIRLNWDQTELESIKKELRLKDEFVVLTVCRISRLKNLEYLIVLAERLKRDDLVFVVVGDGAHKSELEQTIRRKNLQHKIRLYGNSDEPGKFYQIADLYIHPSFYESFCCAIYEAMTAGLPVIFPKTTKPYVSSFEELVETEHSFCIDFNEVESVANTINTLIEDKSLRRESGEKSRNMAQDLISSRLPYAWQIEQIIEENMFPSSNTKK
jgi:glycosyltransferase involved in cell wall biosynthesis